MKLFGKKTVWLKVLTASLVMSLVAAACAAQTETADQALQIANSANSAAAAAQAAADAAAAEARSVQAGAAEMQAAIDVAQAAAILAQSTAEDNEAAVAEAQADLDAANSALADATVAAEKAQMEASAATEEAAAAQERAQAAEMEAEEAAQRAEDAEARAAEAERTAAGTQEIKLAILSDCEGAFGAFHEQDIAGVATAFAEYAGATITNRSKPTDGFTGASVAGVPINLVGIGCADDTAEAAIRETRNLMENLGADIMIGPLSGDESIAVANYAKDHLNQTFINGTAGAQDTTLTVRAPNFFRFNGDGAQWNAGLGDIAKNTLGWETAAVIGDDYSFAWTSMAGFIAEFCAAGGDVISRVFPPLNETNYSGFVEQLPDPDEVDGYFWAVGGAGLIPALKAFEDAKGPVDGSQHIGNLFWGTPGQFEQLGGRVDGAYVGGFGIAGDLKTANANRHMEIITRHFDEIPFGGNPAPASDAHGSGFFLNYHNAAWGLIQALEAVNGDLSNNHEKLRIELSQVVLDGAFGEIRLDENRQAIQDQFVQRIYTDDEGNLAIRTVAFIPAVDQTFGGTFDGDPTPSRDYPACEERDIDWIGNARTVVDGIIQ